MSVMKFILYKTCIIKSYKQSVKHESEHSLELHLVIKSAARPLDDVGGRPDATLDAGGDRLLLKTKQKIMSEFE